jgi:hypothetical protein
MALPLLKDVTLYRGNRRAHPPPPPPMREKIRKKRVRVNTDGMPSVPVLCILGHRPSITILCIVIHRLTKKAAS